VPRCQMRDTTSARMKQHFWKSTPFQLRPCRLGAEGASPMTGNMQPCGHAECAAMGIVFAGADQDQKDGARSMAAHRESGGKVNNAPHSQIGKRGSG